MVTRFFRYFVFAILVCWLAPIAHGSQKTCEEVLLGPRFLHGKFPQLYRSGPIAIAAAKAHAKGIAISQPDQKILAYLEGLEQLRLKGQNSHAMAEQLRKWFHRRYVTRPSEISDSYFQGQIRVARELGYGDVSGMLTKEVRARVSEIAIKDQADSLDAWITYFLSRDSDAYPTWIKYWAMTGVLSLANFNPETHSFNKRSRGQAQLFPELNREAFSILVDELISKLDGSNGSREQVPSFAKLYARALEVTAGQVRDLSVTDGQWVKFRRGSDGTDMSMSLQGMNTGWCTAGLGTAQSLIRDNDFFIYYSLDAAGVPRIPRITIRTEQGAIVEIRGISKDQSLDSQIAGTHVLDEKLKDFGQEGRRYLKRSNDMRRLTEIERKITSKSSLTREDLRFLYEIDQTIDGFGYEKDPRIAELKQGRDAKADIAIALGPKY